MKKETTARQEKEIRSVGEIRSTTDEGILEAYLTRFGTVDEYRSTFTPGSFKKTFQERGDKIKLLWDHDHLIGHVIECREDGYGPLIKGQINMETNAGREAFAHLRAGDVDAMSFGFNVIKDRVEDNVRIISEVRCLEVSPVIFPANEQAKIVDVRSEDFTETVAQSESGQRGALLMNSLWATLDDIWWSSGGPDIAKIEAAVNDFASSYAEWARDYLGQQNYSIPNDNKLIRALYEHSKGDLAAIAQETSLTLNELRVLSRGLTLPIDKRYKLDELPEEVRDAHHKERIGAVEALLNELKVGGFDDSEMLQIRSLLENKEPEKQTEISKTASKIRELREKLAA